MVSHSSRDSVLMQLVANRAHADSKHFGRSCAIASHTFERLQDHPFFHLFQSDWRRLIGNRGRRFVCDIGKRLGRPWRGLLLAVEIHVLRRQLLIPAKENRPLDKILKFAHIAWPFLRKHQ